MEKIIAFFGSDAKSLYKEDIFKVLSLPQEYIIQYRYEKKYISYRILEKLNELKGSKGVIFFTTGNNINLLEQERDITNVPVRKVEIMNMEDDEDTGQIYFYLRLKEFINCKIVKTDENIKILPPYLFVSEILVEDIININWIECIDTIKKYYEKALYFNISIQKKDETVVIPNAINCDKESQFSLEDEEEYLMKVLLYDDTDEKNKFDIENNSDVLEIIKPKTLSVGAEKDLWRISIVTHSLEVSRTVSFLRIYSTANNDELHDILLKVTVNRQIDKPKKIGILSTCAVLGLFLGQASIEAFKNFFMDGLEVRVSVVAVVLLLSACLIYYSASQLYNLFNKK